MRCRAQRHALSGSQGVHRHTAREENRGRSSLDVLHHGLAGRVDGLDLHVRVRIAPDDLLDGAFDDDRRGHIEHRRAVVSRGERCGTERAGGEQCMSERHA